MRGHGVKSLGAPGGFEQKADEGNVAKWTAGAVRASKKWTDVSAWAWGLVVGTPGGFEQKADGESLQDGPRERLERSLN